MPRVARFDELTTDQLTTAQVVYEDAFPPWEREPFGHIVKRSGRKAGMRLAMLETEDVIGLAVLSMLHGVGWWWLEYFAIVDGRRDRGIGGQLWDEMVERLDNPRPPIVMEVEPPEDVDPGSTEYVTRQRRIAFYRRRGAVALEVPEYRVPYLTGDGVGRLILLAVPQDGMEPPTGRHLGELVAAMYLKGYGLAADNPLVTHALVGLGERG